jgi:hypothetical protein
LANGSSGRGRNTNHEFGGRRRVSGSTASVLDVIHEIWHLHTRKKWDIVSANPNPQCREGNLVVSSRAMTAMPTPAHETVGKACSRPAPRRYGKPAYLRDGCGGAVRAAEGKRQSERVAACRFRFAKAAARTGADRVRHETHCCKGRQSTDVQRR